jgi:2-dehydro-3-deoxyphosphogluconate aldolase/(4S)-4-hydroxy-2-oxoglutarate aldolase
MNSILEEIGKVRIIPVIAIDDACKALPLVRAMARGGIPCAEITFRTAQGEEAIKIVAREEPNILLGAGTVLTPDQVDRAINAGAGFIVSPGFNPRVVDYCLNKGIPITPGCSTPSDMEQAIERGLDVVKFFPAEQSGGIDFIKAVSAPYPMLKYIPTGGIGPDNLHKYLSFDKILACGGSWMVKKELVNNGMYEEIESLCIEAAALAVGF